MKQEYTGNNNVTRHLNPPYLVPNLDELNILANSMENRLGITYTTKLIDLDELNILADSMEKRLGLTYTTKLFNCHCRQNGFDAVCRSTVNLAFLRLAPKITRIQNIQQGTKN